MVGSFDTVEHDWLIQMIQHRVKDGRVIDLIIRWIKVGTIDEHGKRTAANIGVPQGAVISPLLSNIYLHYVFDLWSHNWRKKRARGEVIIIRYADDGVLGFQYQREAIRYLEMLHQRMADFGLKVHPKKTRLLRFGRYAKAQCIERGIGRPETFEFLGFTHYCTTKRSGEFTVGRRTSRKRLVNQIRAVKHELRRQLHAPVGDTLKWLKSVIQGHYNYYGVPGNIKRLDTFKSEIVRGLLKMLRRRSQKSKLVWKTFGPFINRTLPKPHIVHAYPGARFDAKYSR